MKHASNFGKYHAPNCECTYYFTCRVCLDNTPKYYWTPNTISDLAVVDKYPNPAILESD